MFEIGQKVVCVNVGRILSSEPRTNVLKEGHVYTVERLGVSDSWAAPETRGEPTLWLVGVPPTCCGNGRLARRFRPVAKRSDTLSIESFLTIKDGFEEPRKVVEPVRRKEGV